MCYASRKHTTKGEHMILSRMKKADELQSTLIEARSWQKRNGICRYVVWNVPMNCYSITDRMPLLGEWYDSDGVRHG